MVQPMGTSQRLRLRMRDNFNASHTPSVAIIWRPTIVPGGDFGTEVELVEVGPVDANWWSVSGREALVLEQMQIAAEGTVSVPAFTDVTELDELVYTVDETGDVHHFKVVFVFDRDRLFDMRLAVTEYKFEENVPA